MCVCVCMCSDLLFHQHAAFVSLLLVCLVDFVPLCLVKTPQSDTQSGTCNYRHKLHPENSRISYNYKYPMQVTVQLWAFQQRWMPHLSSSCTSSSLCCSSNLFKASSKLTRTSSFSFCRCLQHIDDVAERKRKEQEGMWVCTSVLKTFQGLSKVPGLLIGNQCFLKKFLINHYLIKNVGYMTSII